MESILFNAAATANQHIHGSNSDKFKDVEIQFDVVIVESHSQHVGVLHIIVHDINHNMHFLKEVLSLLSVCLSSIHPYTVFSGV